MPTLAKLLVALLGADPLTRQERRLIAHHLCRLLRERWYRKEGIGPLAEPES